MRNPIIVALDTDDPREAIGHFKKLKDLVGGFKVGPRLTFRADKSFLKDISQAGILFFDHKFYDIPSTTVSAVKAAAELGAHWVTVHALNGPKCLRELASLETEIRKSQPEFKILAVTILTSFNPDTLPKPMLGQSIDKLVSDLAMDGINAGFSSFVCSSSEVQQLKSRFPKGFFVVPGVRPRGSSTQDQKRTATPKEAIQQGASALVIGRPILEASHPLEQVKQILSDLA